MANRVYNRLASLPSALSQPIDHLSSALGMTKTLGSSYRISSRLPIYPEIWKKYVSHEKSGYAAYHGSTQPPENADEIDELTQAHGVRSRDDRHDSETSSRTIGNGVNEASGVRVDPEKGKDLHVVDWYGPDDPQVCSPQLGMLDHC